MDLVFVMFLVFSVYILQRNLLLARLHSAEGKVNENFFDVLFGVHLLLWVVYLLYAYATRSDSFEYFNRSSDAENWNDLWGTGTTFIRWVAYPFSNLLELSFNSVMLIFSFLGFQGMLFLYLAARENIAGLPTLYFGFTLVELLFLLPNSHFWSASLGKGSMMTFAIGLSLFGLSRFNQRILHIALGAFLVYMIRPHILLAIILGVGIGVSFAQQGLKLVFRIPMILIAIIGLSLISEDVMEFSKTESLNVMNSDFIANRAFELSKSSSGVDLSNYGQLMRLFTFLFRPLFIDAPGVMGIFSSIENAFLIIFTFNLIRFSLPTWGRWNGFFLSAFFIFILGSIALAQVAGNLGIAMRQKAQIMPLFYMVYARVISLRFSDKLARGEILFTFSKK